ncbi:MAG TPA: hypothetical protein VND97_02515, partial [Beijerinckiaceae bacterium]|nr:hypothetical protein [Beijerinckiaceae bacterium]
MKKRMALLGGALLAALLSTSQVQAAEKITIGVIGSPAAGAWPWSIAQEEGFFKKAGIQPDFVYVPSAPGLMQQLIAG